MNEVSLINALCEAKGYHLSFEPVVPGSVICRAIKGPQQFRVLAKSVREGLRELGRLLGLNAAWRMNP